MLNMKNERCPHDPRVFCQEGFCDGCAIYQHYVRGELVKKEEREIK